MTEKITETPVGQAFVHDPAPKPSEAARAAITEADHLLDKLAEGYVTIGAGDPEAEVIRQLVDSAQFYGGVLQNVMGLLEDIVASARDVGA